MVNKDEVIMNDKIKASTVLLIGEDGTNYGEISVGEARQLASDKDLDILQVSDKKVPTCKLVNYGKFLYERSKKTKHKKNLVTKGMRTSYNIDDHDLLFKHKQVKQFLTKGQPVIYSLILEGREKGKVQHALSKFKDRLTDFDGICEWKNPNIGHSRKRLTISTTLHPKRDSV